MIKFLIGLAGCVFIFGLLFLTMVAENSSERTGNLRHVVFFKFKGSTAADQILLVESAFRNLQNKIPQIASYESGTNVSREGFDKGFTHGFILTFHSESDRDHYLEHPDHQAFVQLLGPHLEDALVVDFWAE